MTTDDGVDGAQFVVRGLPIPQGSKGARVAGRRRHDHATGGVWVLNPIATLFDTNSTKLNPWRATVRDIAALAADRRRRDGADGPLDGPLHLGCTFRMPMPKSRRAVYRRRGWMWCAVKPDLDKLIRAIGDSMTDAKLIAEDSRISSLRATMIETTAVSDVGVTVQVYQLNDDGSPVGVRPLPIWTVT